jgi:hypothetical protein
MEMVTTAINTSRLGKMLRGSAIVVSSLLRVRLSCIVHLNNFQMIEGYPESNLQVPKVAAQTSPPPATTDNQPVR